MTNTKNYWWPIAIAGDIKATQPTSILFKQKPLVAFRSQENKIHVLDDVCPHRFAPLSRGKVINGELQCLYHGWQFNGEGVCTKVPGLTLASPNSPVIQTYPIREEFGLLWISEPDVTNQICSPASQAEQVDVFFMQGAVDCELINIIENFLDGFHTHFIHSGWIRKDKQRQTIQATIKPLPDGVEVEYTGEAQQNGFISRWLESDRGASYARFHLPNMAELEYRDSQNRLSLLATLWATPTTRFQHKIFLRIATPRRILPARFKEFFLRKLFSKIMDQDKRILELSHQHKNNFSMLGVAQQQPLDTSNDLLAPLLRQLIATQEAENFTTKIQTVQL